MNKMFCVHYKDCVIRVSKDDVTDMGNGQYHISRMEFDADWTFEPHAQGDLVSLTVQNHRDEPICRLDSIRIVGIIPQKEDKFSFLGNRLHYCETRYVKEMKVGMEYFGDCFGKFSSFTSPGIVVAGVIPFTYDFGAGSVLDENGAIEYFAKTDFTVQEGNVYKAEKVWYSEKSSMDEVYRVYRNFIPKSDFAMPKLTGWNTWDYYLDDICPEVIYDNVSALKMAGFSDQLDYIVMDDGWQKEWGVWTENEKFSCGLDVIADRIREEGFIPGIWMAPLGIKKHSKLLTEKQEWFLRDRKGELLYDGVYYLDPTHPEVEAKIKRDYKNLYQKGFRLFKIDYLGNVTAAGAFYKKGASPYQVLRDLIAMIQKETGEDAVILGCSLPLQCGANLAPSMRIGVDIHNHFSHVEWIADQLSWMWMYNNITSRIDTDFIVVRGRDDEEVEESPKPSAQETKQDIFKRRWRAGATFTYQEARTWARLVAMSGGNIFFSDRISELDEKRLDILKEAMEIQSEEAVPVYLESDKRRPSLWVSDRKLLFINWEAKDVVVETQFEGKQYKFNLRAHDSMIFDR